MCSRLFVSQSCLNHAVNNSPSALKGEIESTTPRNYLLYLFRCYFQWLWYITNFIHKNMIYKHAKCSFEEYEVLPFTAKKSLILLGNINRLRLFIYPKRDIAIIIYSRCSVR